MAVRVLMLVFILMHASHIVDSAENSHDISIGILTPLTSSNRIFGTDHLQAVTLAIEQANASGLLGDFRLRLIIQDESSPQTVLNKIRLLNNANVVAVLGPCTSSVSTTAIKESLVGEGIQIPFVSALATAPELTNELNHHLFFRANVSDSKRMAELISLVFTSSRPKNIALLYEEADAYGEGMKKSAESILRSKYENMATWEFFNHKKNIESTDAKLLMEQVKQKGYAGSDSSVVFLSLDYDGQTFAEEAKALGFTSQLYVVEADHRRIQRSLKEGKALGGLRMVSAYYPRSADLVPFQSAFRRRFKEDITFASALSYDAAQILIDSISKVIIKYPPNKNSIKEFRLHLAEELRTGNRDNVKFVLPGNKKFKKNEYSGLRFNGYHFSNQGEIIPWDEPLGKPFPKQ